MMKLMRVLAVLSMVLLVGCASNPMRVSETTTVEQPKEDKSQVIFLRDSFVGSAINASLFDVTSGEPEFLGIIGNKMKIKYQTEPGDHVFMVVSEAADFMEAEVAPGKRYYSIVTPRMGVWKARFSLWPVKNDPDAEYHTGMDQFEQWKTNTRLVELTPEAREWFADNRPDIAEKYREYWADWQEKSPEELERRTLAPNDAM